MSDQFSVAGKVILITGAARGIGRTLTMAFHAAGAIVLPVVRRGGTDLPLPSGDECRWHRLTCDLADPDQLHRLPEQALEAAHGRIDVLVNNAGITYRTDSDPFDIPVQRATYAVMFDAPYFLCGRIAPVMADQGGGSIINVTSINAHLAFPANPAYVSAKGALRMLTRSIARDYGPAGVRANNLCPGYVETDMTAGSQADPRRRGEIAGHTMLDRWGRPEDLVGPALFLASDASAYVTGTDLVVDGGWLAKGL